MQEERTDYQKVEGMLYNYKKDKAELESMRLEKQNILKEPSLQSPRTDEFRPSPTLKVSTPTEDLVLGALEVADYLRHQISILAPKVRKIEIGLDGLTSKEREVIEYRYFDEMELVDIGAVLDCSRNTIAGIRDSAMSKLVDSIITLVEV